MKYAEENGMYLFLYIIDLTLSISFFVIPYIILTEFGFLEITKLDNFDLSSGAPSLRDIYNHFVGNIIQTEYYCGNIVVSLKDTSIFCPEIRINYFEANATYSYIFIISLIATSIYSNIIFLIFILMAIASKISYYYIKTFNFVAKYADQNFIEKHTFRYMAEITSFYVVLLSIFIQIISG